MFIKSKYLLKDNGLYKSFKLILRNKMMDCSDPFFLKY